MNETDLVEATLNVLAQHGTSGVTIDRIAEAADISRATLYRRDVDKDELIVQAMQRAADRYQQALWPALVGPGTARDRLADALHAVCASAEDHLALLAGLFEHPHSPFHDDGTDEGAVTVREPFAEPFERLLRDGAIDGTLHAEDPVETATVIFNLSAWTYIHLRIAHGWEPRPTAERIVTLILEGVGTRTTDDA